MSTFGGGFNGSSQHRPKSKRGYDLTVSSLTLITDEQQAKEIEAAKQRIKDAAKSGL
jgi:hypothetical protein